MYGIETEAGLLTVVHVQSEDMQVMNGNDASALSGPTGATADLTTGVYSPRAHMPRYCIICTHTHTHTHMYMHIDIHIMHTDIDIHIHMHLHLHLHLYLYMYIKCVCVCVCVFMSVCLHMHIYIIHICMFVWSGLHSFRCQSLLLFFVGHTLA